MADQTPQQPADTPQRPIETPQRSGKRTALAWVGGVAAAAFVFGGGWLTGQAVEAVHLDGARGAFSAPGSPGGADRHGPRDGQGQQGRPDQKQDQPDQKQDQPDQKPDQQDQKPDQPDQKPDQQDQKPDRQRHGSTDEPTTDTSTPAAPTGA